MGRSVGGPQRLHDRRPKAESRRPKAESHRPDERAGARRVDLEQVGLHPSKVDVSAPTLIRRELGTEETVRVPKPGVATLVGVATAL